MTDLSEISVTLDCEVWTFPHLKRVVVTGTVDGGIGDGTGPFVHSYEIADDT